MKHLRLFNTVCRCCRWLVPVVYTAGAWGDTEKSTGATSLLGGAYLLQVLGSLILVFGAIFGVLFLLKKLNGLPLSSSSPIRILASSRVGTREKIILLEAGQQQLLVGVTSGCIRTLHVLDKPILDTAASAGKNGNFASVLGASLQGRDSQ